MMVDPTLSENKLSIKVIHLAIIIHTLDSEPSLLLPEEKPHFLRALLRLRARPLPAHGPGRALLRAGALRHAGHPLAAPGSKRRRQQQHERGQDRRPDEESEVVLKQGADAPQHEPVVPQHERVRDLHR